MTEDGKDPSPTNLEEAFQRKIATEKEQEEYDCFRAAGFAKLHRVEVMRGEFVDIATFGDK